MSIDIVGNLSKDDIEKKINKTKDYHDGILLTFGNPLHDPNERGSHENHYYSNFLQNLTDKQRDIDLGICTYILGHLLSINNKNRLPELNDHTGNVWRETFKRLTGHFTLINKNPNLVINREIQEDIINGLNGKEEPVLRLGWGTYEVFNNFGKFNPKKDLQKLGKSMNKRIYKEIFDIDLSDEITTAKNTWKFLILIFICLVVFVSVINLGL
mgnify:CR=1 FL=1